MTEKRILIVDDDDEIRELLEFDVKASGYFVDTARDGLEGLVGGLAAICIHADREALVPAAEELMAGTALRFEVAFATSAASSTTRS